MSRGSAGRRVLAFLGPLLFLALSPLPLQAGDPAAGKTKAKSCVTCHGADGVAVQPDAPHLAGQKAHYTAKQLRAFRDGRRIDPVMNVASAKLSDQDIEDLAAFYEALGTQKPE